MKKLLAVSALILLAGCAGADRLDSLGRLTVADLDAATEIARSADDRMALACWPVLKEWVLSIKPMRDETRAVEGAVSAFQRARNARRRIEDGIPVDVRIGCSALALDSRDAILRLLARVAGL